MSSRFNERDTKLGKSFRLGLKSRELAVADVLTHGLPFELLLTFIAIQFDIYALRIVSIKLEMVFQDINACSSVSTYSLCD